MSATDRHIINKLTVEVTTPSTREGYAIRSNVRSFIDRHVVPAVEQYVGELAGAIGDHEFLQIDRLDISVDTDRLDLDGPGLPAVIREQIAQALQAKKQAVPAVGTVSRNELFAGSDQVSQNSDGMRRLAPEAHGVETLFYFLEHGSRPWWSEDPAVFNALLNEKTVLERIAAARTFKVQFLQKIALSAVRRRLICQFSDEFLVQLLLVVQPDETPQKLPKSSKALKELLGTLFGNIPASLREATWQVVLRATVQRLKGQPPADTALAEELFSLFQPAAHKSDLQQNGGAGKTKGTSTVADPAKSVSDSKSIRALTIPEERALKALQLIHLLAGKKETTTYYRRLIERFADARERTASKTNRQSVASTIKTPSRKQNDMSATVIGDAQRISGVPNAEASNEKDAKIGQELLSSGYSGLSEEQRSASPKDPAEEHRVATDQVNPANEERPAFGKKNQLEEQRSGSTGKIQTEQRSASRTNSGEEQSAGTAAKKREEQQSVTPAHKAKQQQLSDLRKAQDDAPPVTNPAFAASETRTEQRRVNTGTETPQQEPGHLVVDNAGMVLVHPFIRQLFLTVGLLDEQKQITDKVLAAHVLHYLATGAENDFEHAMQFEKYLVGIPFTESIDRYVPLSEAIKTEVSELLVSVKQNWKAMAGSSPEAIRETFLQRSGKLMNDTQPRLIVERKTVDILLDQLPWGLSIVKLPWMEQLIFVEW